MMRKKLFALFMTGVMATCMLSGCGNSSGKSTHKNKLEFIY